VRHTAVGRNMHHHKQILFAAPCRSVSLPPEAVRRMSRHIKQVTNDQFFHVFFGFFVSYLVPSIFLVFPSSFLVLPVSFYKLFKTRTFPKKNLI
jgi:hypothetical protein